MLTRRSSIVLSLLTLLITFPMALLISIGESGITFESVASELVTAGLCMLFAVLSFINLVNIIGKGSDRNVNN